MWLDIVPFSRIRNCGRWKVEFFCGDSTLRPDTAYDSVPLREVLNERREALDPQAFPDRLFNYLGLEHVQSMTGDLVDFRPRPGRKILSRCKVFRQGDVLYGRLRPYLNKVFLAWRQVPEGICSGEFYVLTPDTELVLPHFARAILASKYVQGTVGGLLTGSALPRLQIEDLLAIEVPLPPIVQQRLIEEFIVQEDQRRRQLAVELAHWPPATMEAIVNSVESGRPPSKLQRPHDQNGGEEFTNPLPPGDFCSGRAKRGIDRRQALLELS